MAWPTESADLAVQQIDATLISIRERAVSAITRMATEAVTSEYILNLHTDIKSAGQTLENFKSVPGVVAAAREAKDDPTLDVVAEFLAIQTKLVELRDWIESNFPKEGGGGVWLRHVQFVNNVATFATFSSAATAGLRTKLQELVDLILV